ncbi:Branched-chain amino acid transport system 2 carrier protein [Kordia antarctica]|uniref:Branched-chain amino acid transport system 2 carrier protein n=1 Tax=Kordia antarctica TaxID=1218801 RepID=A0A7L4ZMN3_9FLAO|nr:branched-chain amino acid transport system II carrier protein [Kordia antarctica]QHI37963.1 Branched-chain amino acid transport system 2 carrier protein [Kordia antarctica]
MSKNKELFITSFALFSMFFGAGNLLLPPLLGYQATDQWFWVTLGFMITAVVVPIFGILAHARLQGSMFDFGKKVSPLFSSIFCIIIYIISVTIPSPRTAAATHEISIFPNFGTNALLTSSLYFALVLVFVLNRSKILNFLGKFLTPLIVLILLAIIGIGLLMPHEAIKASEFTTPLFTGLEVGYQTFDAIGAIVIGGVIIISLNLKGITSFEEKKKLIAKSGWIAGFGLFVMYAGLILLGSYFSSEVDIDLSLSNDMKRANLLRGISLATLGNIGTAFLSVLVALACFTTAVGITTGTADYFKGLFNNSKNAYTITAIIACLIGIIIGQLGFHYIYMIAGPVLKFIYPIAIVLIFLNIAPTKYATPLVFRAVVLVTFIFGFLDMLAHFFPTNNLLVAFRETISLGGILDMLTHFFPENPYLIAFRETISLGTADFGWVLPSFLTFLVVGLVQKNKQA